MVFRAADGSLAYQLETAAFGAWAATGSTVYFFVRGEQGFVGELDSVGASGQAQTVVSSINGFFWPRVTPDGAAIVYDTYDGAALPHLWRVDLATHAVAQLSGAARSQPVFVTRTFLCAAHTHPAPASPASPRPPAPPTGEACTGSAANLHPAREGLPACVSGEEHACAKYFSRRKNQGIG